MGNGVRCIHRGNIRWTENLSGYITEVQATRRTCRLHLFGALARKNPGSTRGEFMLTEVVKISSHILLKDLLSCFLEGMIVSLAFYHRRQPAISGTDTAVIPIPDKESPNERLEFINGHLFGVITSIK